MEVVPGKLYTMNYYAENRSDETIIGQAVPSVAPGQAASHLKKLECFCFNNQEFKPKEPIEMPVRFFVDSEIGKDEEINSMQSREEYYVPDGSYWPIVGSVGMFALLGGFAGSLHDSVVGTIAYKVDKSFRMGMGWFIFSEVMFFAAFFGALFYARQLSVPWLGGEGNNAFTAQYLWPEFKSVWPLINMPDSANFTVPKGIIHAWEVPAINTLLLLTSGATLTWAHWALMNKNRNQLIGGLVATIVLGIAFLGLQVYEYYEAYQHLDLKLTSGIYGSTFFMLTGFHGIHVTLGTLMLIVILMRAIRGHFNKDRHFGFEAVACLGSALYYMMRDGDGSKRMVKALTMRVGRMTAFQLRVSNYLFTPKLIPTIATLILFPVLVSLGLWQLERAEEKREIDLGVQQAIAKMPLKLNDAESLTKETLLKEVYRPATIRGKYDSDNQFLLDNRTHLGKPGYHVLTPFRFESVVSDNKVSNKTINKAVLINRGWITYNGTRDNIPSIEVEKNDREILGQIKQITDAIVLNDADKEAAQSNSNPKLIQSIQIAELNKELNYELLPIVIELNKQSKDGFVREWQPYYGSIDKHNAYALQWFAMAAILLFLFIRLNTKKN
ncbi:Cytochrome c oxidase subunit 3 [Nymphon striatum]|nr:Cytochrome c oxidase subunit 3 [Nymphon striatum]